MHKPAVLLALTLLLAPTVASAQPPSCGNRPRFQCRSPNDERHSSISIIAGAPKIVWKYRQGDPTSIADFGDPLTATSYTLCTYVFASSGAITQVLSAAVPPGSLWRATAKGFTYSDPSAAAGGVFKVILDSGDKSKSRMTVKARGAALAMPTLPLDPAGVVVSQIVNDAGTCWETRFVPPASASDGARFKDKAERGPGAFGVMASLGLNPATSTKVAELGSGWMRLNLFLANPASDASDIDRLRGYLLGGQNLIVTLVNQGPGNLDATFGTPSQWPNAGFPFRVDAPAYEQNYRARLHGIVEPLFQSALAAGRQVWFQCENEVGDASISSGSVYWRGTADQYLATLAAFADEVRSVSPAIPVVLSSFASDPLEKASDPTPPMMGDPGYANYQYATTLLGRLLLEGDYDFADLHFYGCVDSIDRKIDWVLARLPAGRNWISSEDGGPDIVDCPGVPDWRTNLDGFEQAKASELLDRLAKCSARGGAVCLWFSLFDLQGEVDRFNHLGLLDPALPDVSRPAYDAYAVFLQDRH